MKAKQTTHGVHDILRVSNGKFLNKFVTFKLCLRIAKDAFVTDNTIKKIRLYAEGILYFLFHCTVQNKWQIDYKNSLSTK